MLIESIEMLSLAVMYDTDVLGTGETNISLESEREGEVALAGAESKFTFDRLDDKIISSKRSMFNYDQCLISSFKLMLWRFYSCFYSCLVFKFQ